jgi:hypothetical protein
MLKGGLSDMDPEKINTDNIPSGGFPPIYKINVQQKDIKREARSRDTSIDIKKIFNSVKK